MKKNLFLILIFFTTELFFAQYKIGQWADHLPYNSAVSVTRGYDKVYAATGGAVFSLNWADNSIERLNKITGLNDVGAKIVKFNDYNNTMIVAYSNSNIDVLKDGEFLNFSDIKRKNITADKTIYGVSFYKQFAYIATGFGIVVFDTDRLEFKDTYIIGPNGGYLSVLSVAANATTIYAGTETGLKQASINSNLADFSSWTNVPSLPARTINCVARYENYIFANYSAYQYNGGWMQDTLYIFDGNAWSVFPKNFFSSSESYIIRSVLPDEKNHLVMIVDQWNPERWEVNSGWQLIKQLWGVSFKDENNKTFYPDYTEAVYTPAFGNENYCLGTKNCGLIRYENWTANRILIDGPVTNYVSQVEILKDKLIMAPSYLTEVWYNQYRKTGVYTRSKNDWKNITKHPLGDSIEDINCVEFFNNDPDHFFAGSWGHGLLEFRGDTLYKIHNNSNSALQPATTTATSVRINGIVSDSLGNLWVSNAFTKYVIAVLKPNNTWANLNFGNFVQNTNVAGKILIDKNNQKWVLLPGTGFLVYDDGGNYAQPNSANTKKITSSAGNGGLPSGQVYAMCEDKDGDIWVGSDKGVAVFYNPESILSSSGGWDAQQIIIEQNGVAKILLETEIVYDIAVDGINRKWIASKTGVYCFSPDGQTEIYHFTTDNSPLFSNTVIDLEYDGLTGDIYFGTTEGLQSYRTDVIDAFDNFTDVYSYPNPVRPGYEGPIIIKGMVADANVKITDISGALVYETQSRGGQAVWYGKNFKGERVSSGVYVVFCASSDGEQKILTKILVVN
jgi:hypothetical protein